MVFVNVYLLANEVFGHDTWRQLSCRYRRASTSLWCTPGCSMSLLSSNSVSKYTGKKAPITRSLRVCFDVKVDVKALRAGKGLHPGSSCCPGRQDPFLKGRRVFVACVLLPRLETFFKGQEHCSSLNSCAQGSLSMDLAFLLTVCWTKVTLIQYIKIVFFHSQLVHLGEWSGTCRYLFFWEVFLNISSSPFLYSSTFFYVLFVQVCKNGRLCSY